jgi:integrase
LMLAAGENPEWIARIMGHVDTTMLFKVYSRFIPNLTRQDGQAMAGLINRNWSDDSANGKSSTENTNNITSLQNLPPEQLAQLLELLKNNSTLGETFNAN